MLIFLCACCIFASLTLLYHRQKPLESIFKEEDEVLPQNVQRGKALEEEIEDLLVQLPGKFLLYKNFYVPLPQNKWTEIDVLLIHEKGIFVFESKNYTGTIKGTIHDSHWTKTYNESFEQRFYSPIRQNATHIRALTALIGQVKPIYSIIVFGRDSTLHVDTMPATNLYICKITQFAFLKDILQTLQPQISLDVLQEQLEPWRFTTEETQRKHVESIKIKYRNKAIS